MQGVSGFVCKNREQICSCQVSVHTKVYIKSNGNLSICILAAFYILLYIHTHSLIFVNSFSAFQHLLLLTWRVQSLVSDLQSHWHSLIVHEAVLLALCSTGSTFFSLVYPAWFQQRFKADNVKIVQGFGLFAFQSSGILHQPFYASDTILPYDAFW